MEHGSFVGWTGDDELHSLYRIADLCLVPSIYEPFGLVALEAMASGCPCIVADTGGLREVVPGGGRVGLRFRPKDSKALGRMAEQLLTDDALRDRLVAEAREHVLRFDWADVARQTAAVYARARRRRHDGVGADRGPGRDARARPERRVRADPRAVADRDRPRGERLQAHRDLDVRARRLDVGEHRPLADHGARADRDLATARRSRCARRSARPRRSRRVPPGRLDPAARGPSRQPSPSRTRPPSTRTRAPRATCTSRPASSAPRGAGAQPREPQPRGEPPAARRDDRVGADRGGSGHPFDDGTPRSASAPALPITWV